MNNKVGILGGTFNPIHKGHISIALQAKQCLNLKTVIFIPSGCSYMKREEHILPGNIRMDMVKLAISPYLFFESSDIEIKRQGNTYTCDTLKELKFQNPDNEYYFICGYDTFFQLSKWKSPKEIFKYSNVAVAYREDEMDNTILMDNFSNLKTIYEEKYKARIFSLPVLRYDISSTRIRNIFKDGKIPSEDMMNNEELNYIVNNGYYK